MKCKEVEKILPDFLKESLDTEKLQQVKVHIESCLPCRNEVAGLNLLWTKLDAIPEEQPSERMDSQFERMMEIYGSGFENGKNRFNLVTFMNDILSKILPKTPLVQFAALSFIFAFGWLVGGDMINFTPAESAEVAQMRDEIRDLRNIMALSLLNQSSVSERIKSVQKFNQFTDLNDDGINTLLTVFNSDPSENVRMASLGVLNNFVEKPFIKEALLEALGQQESVFVQLTLIELFVRLREDRALQIFTQLLKSEDLNINVRKRLDWGIQQLS